MSDIAVDSRGHVAIITLKRPPANYFRLETIREIADAAFYAVDRGARAIVLASEGKHFCAGADFGVAGEESDRVARSIRLYGEAVRLFRVPVPVIAAVQGSAVGGGVGLACAADFRIAAESTRFQANFVHLGFHPGFGLSESLPFIVGRQRAHELLTTGVRLTGMQAHAIGLVDRLVEPDSLLEAAVAWAEEIATAAPLAVRSVKETMRAGLADRVEQAVNRELVEQTLLWQTEDSRRGIEASLRRKRGEFVGR